MIYFLSNHNDVDTVAALVGESVELIAHPYIQPEWTVEEIWKHCADTMEAACRCDALIINGDYTLVGMVVLARAVLGKSTGFVCFRKDHESSVVKNADGSITHTNVLIPVNVRWL